MYLLLLITGVSQLALAVKNLPANAGRVRDLGSIPDGEDPSDGLPRATHSRILAWSTPWTEESKVSQSGTQLSGLTRHAFAKGIPTLVYVYLCSPCSLTHTFLDGPQSSPVAAAGTENRSCLGP